MTSFPYNFLYNYNEIYYKSLESNINTKFQREIHYKIKIFLVFFKCLNFLKRLFEGSKTHQTAI